MVTSIQHKQQQCRWHTFATTAELEQNALRNILSSAASAIMSRNGFHIVLAGGTTPQHIYLQLRNAQADWHKWHIYFGDERCLPAEHAERNSMMAQRAWLDHVSIPHNQIHVMHAELGAEAAASAYAQALANMGQFDLVLLGLGDDGHTASLFPGHDWGMNQDGADVIAVHNAPKPPPDRVSLSARRLSRTLQLMYLVTGVAKKQAIQSWRNGRNIPAAAIAPDSGVDIYLEKMLLDEQ